MEQLISVPHITWLSGGVVSSSLDLALPHAQESSQLTASFPFAIILTMQRL